MSFSFRVDVVDSLLHCISPLTRFQTQNIHIKWSSQMLSLTISNKTNNNNNNNNNNNSSPHFIIIASLRFSSSFFQLYSYNYNTRHFEIPLQDFINILTQPILKNSSFTFSIMNHFPMAFFQFRNNINCNMAFDYELPLLLSNSNEEDRGQINYTRFASIASQVFGRIIAQLNDCLVRVILTNFEVKFVTNSNAEGIVLTKEGRQCIIEGVGVGDQIEFLITLHPMLFFQDLLAQSIRVCLYKRYNNLDTMIVPFGNYAQYVIYFP